MVRPRRLRARREAAREWDVTNVVDEEAARIAVVDAAQNEPHPLDRSLTAPDVPSVSLIGPAHYLVKQVYRRAPNGTWADTELDDLDKPPRFRWSKGFQDEESAVDANNVLMTDAAGTPFVPPLRRPIYHRFFTVTRWESKYDLAKAEAFENTVNLLPVRFPLTPGTVAPGRVMLLNYAPTGDYDETSTKVSVVYEFELFKGSKRDADGLWDSFKFRILNAGYEGWYDDDGTKKRGKIIRENGKDLTCPAALDKLGKPIDATLKIENKAGAGVSAAENPSPLSGDLFEASGSGDNQRFFLKFPKLVAANWNGLNLFNGGGT